MEWSNIAVIVAGVGLVVSFFQWHVNQNYRRLQEQIRDAIGRQASIEDELKNLGERMEATREEMHRDFVRTGQLRDANREIKHELENVFEKLSGLSRALSEIIGELRVRRHVVQDGSGDANNVL